MTEYNVIGDKLRSTRNKMGLSLSEVANLTGVSKTMLSQIERSESMPTIATVWKIANGLKIKFETLLDTTTNQYEVRDIETIMPLKGEKELITVYSMFPFSPLSGVEILYSIMKPGCDYSSGSHQNSCSEYLIVSQGELDLIVGTKRYHLKAGTAINFDPRENHRYINNGDEDVIAQFVMSYE